MILVFFGSFTFIQAKGISLTELITNQTIPITGKVTDVNNEPMIGVTVILKNTNTGTVTDMNGNFSLNVNSANDIISISYLGYKTEEFTVKNVRNFNIVLHEDETLLEEVVVVGYGSMKKRDLSGSVAQVKADEILSGNPAASINQALQGRVAGAMVNQNDGAPGAGISMQIRGTNSFSSNSQPLYIVDGIPFEVPATPRSAENTDGSLEASANALSFINPHDIASIEVLKDASATAIYGSRGANGVVLITTKSGEKGKPRIEFTSNVSSSTIRKQVPVLDGYHYALYRNEQQDNALLYDSSPFTQYVYPSPGTWRFDTSNGEVLSAKYNPSPEDFLSPGWREGVDGNGGTWKQWVEGTNWQDQIFQTGYSQEYNMLISSATDRGNYTFSGNYTSQDGIIKGTGFERYTLRSNTSQNISKNITVGLNLSYTNSTTDFAKGNSLDYSILRSALLYPSTIYYGDFSQSDELLWLSANPRTYVTSTKNELSSVNIFASAFASIRLHENLVFRQNLGLSNFENQRSTYSNRDTGEGAIDKVNGKGGLSDNRQAHTVTESMLTYNRIFGKIHNLNAVAAVTYEHRVNSAESMTATQFPTDLTENYDMGLALVPGSLVSSKFESKLFSMLGRVNYVLNDKYIFTASFRRDGSSKFSSENRYANFASGALAWRLSEEAFIKNLNLFDNLKLRLSYGQTGNQAIPDYQTMYTMRVANYPLGGSEHSGFVSDHAFNTSLKWETTDQYNAGIDFGFYNNRLSFIIDYYYKKTNDLLQNVKTPQSTGYISQIINSGYVTNEGLELTANLVPVQNKLFNWRIDANLSFNRNRIGGLQADQFSSRLWYKADNVFIQRNGLPIGAIYGYVEDGFYDNEAEVRADPTYASASANVVKSMIGEIKYKEGLHVIGDTNPDYIFGVTNNFEWNNFNFGFFVQGVMGNDIFNGNLMNVTLFNTTNIPVAVYDYRWTPETKDIAKWPKATNQAKRTWLISDRYVEDGSYIRLKNINIGYTFDNPKFLKGIRSINLNASASNLFTLTDYSWYDPDVNAFGNDPARRGVDVYSYPTSKTFSLGLKVQF
ncbi:MAG: TonB-dependent receptor [Porphyromonadaceae bacterium]|nr:TonB-dependent receptor [Porphyromonadaceae bacterium]